MVSNRQGNWGGARVGSGAKKQPSRLVNEALARCDQKFPEIYQTLIDKALGSPHKTHCPECRHEFTVEYCNPDANVAIYLVDRRLGKPRQSIDARVAAVIVTADDYELATRLTQAIEAKVIESYSIQLGEGNGQSVTKAENTG